FFRLNEIERVCMRPLVKLVWEIASQQNIYDLFSLGFNIENMSTVPLHLHPTQQVLPKSYIHIIQASITHSYLHPFILHKVKPPPKSRSQKTTTRAGKTTCIP
ncbi:hypothetical protein TorRG33x02_158070, partial [Trema orientale]